MDMSSNSRPEARSGNRAAWVAVDVPRLPRRGTALQKCFVDGWYLTGDLAKRDENGYFWFIGRADDVIKTAGHLIGPFEVESVLMEDPRVAEAGDRRARPDDGRADQGVRPAQARGTTTRRRWRELTAHARRRLGFAVAPREIEFSDDLPKTRSGKIMRRLLKARELGLPEGDLSTLETPGGDKTSDRWNCCDRCCAYGVSRSDASSCTARPRSEDSCTYIGEEAVATGVMAPNSSPMMRVVATYREHGHALLKGMSAQRDGRDVRQGHRCSPWSRRVDAPVRQGARLLRRQRDRRRGLPTAVGLALADKMLDRDRVTVFLREGAIRREWHESMNRATVEPSGLFVCENNLYAMGTGVEPVGIRDQPGDQGLGLP